ncbi:PAS domain-containing sensor histidine kinase [Loktanella sp. SALINAS62]|uniref:PAS domain-containing sensor histidine kinase n=1 Tax=Loktanella sp. SALINAS62 TaxID=2706124 RepID=UPI001B8B033B|nr:PAS domain-containing sensor histidine kinase [Loktanella sp. SALINAS62]MBS1303882.1 PAS domain-containing protein [Loktanella sp. SALINAS62]
MQTTPNDYAIIRPSDADGGYENSRSDLWLLSALPDPIVAFDPDAAMIVHANAAACRLFGWNDAAQRPLADLVLDTGADTLLNDLRRASVLRRETHVTTKGQLFSVESQRCGSDVARSMIVTIWRGGPSQTTLTPQGDDFVATVSHELRTPLTSVKGALGLALSGAAGPITDKTRSLLDIAHRNVGRLMLLVNDILDLEKMSSGHMAFDMNRADLRDTVAFACEANSTFADEFGVTLDCQIPSEPAMVIFDADRMHQVMTNLISNACKFSHPDGTVRVKLDRKADGAFEISVTDHGIGIPSKAVSSVFDRFNQAGSVHRNRSGSTGLGLAIVKTIIEEHGGTIALSSIEGVGTTVTVAIAPDKADCINRTSKV